MHGSTRTVAEAIAGQARSEGHDAQVIFVQESASAPSEGDLMFIGSPTRGGNMTKRTREFVDSLDAGRWKDGRIFTFDTLGPISKDPEKRKVFLETKLNETKTAAYRMRVALQERGIPVEGTMHFPVTGLWGPAAPEAPGMAREMTSRILAQTTSRP